MISSIRVSRKYARRSLRFYDPPYFVICGFPPHSGVRRHFRNGLRTQPKPLLFTAAARIRISVWFADSISTVRNALSDSPPGSPDPSPRQYRQSAGL